MIAQTQYIYIITVQTINVWTNLSWFNYTWHLPKGEYIFIRLFSSDTLCWLTSSQALDGQQYCFLCRQIMRFLLSPESYYSPVSLDRIRVQYSLKFVVRLPILRVHCTQRPAWPYLFYTVFLFFRFHTYSEFNILGLTPNLFGFIDCIYYASFPRLYFRFHLLCFISQTGSNDLYEIMPVARGIKPWCVTVHSNFHNFKLLRPKMHFLSFIRLNYLMTLLSS